MIRRFILGFLLLNVSILIAAQNTNSVAEANKAVAEVTSNKNTTTTESPTTEPPTTPTPTPSSSTTSTTQKPTTSTSTAKPSTTSTSKTTTTSPTTTTEPPKPTPTPPQPFPKNVGNWTVVNAKDNVTCILLKGAIEIEVSVTENNKTTKNDVWVPKEAIGTGKCGELEQEITLTWQEEPMSTSESSITFYFQSNTTNSSSKYELKAIKGAVYAPKNSTKEVNFTLELSTHQLPKEKSYKCNTEETFKTIAEPNVQVKVANVQMEAFRNKNGTVYSAAEECAADGYVADIVPIAVGCSLAGLVVIVLIAYLFGRRRARARGYQSV